MSDLVAKIPVVLSIKRDEEVIVESEEGEARLRRDEFEFVAEDYERIIPLSACVDVRVATVPDDYSGLLDETIALKFEGKDSEWEVVLHADTDTTERFVTVLSKLLLDETTVLVSEMDESAETQTKDRGSLTVAPGTETVHLGTDDPLAPIATRQLLTVDTTALSEGSIRAVRATHLTDDAIVRTEVAFQSRRRRRFLHRYLDFRQERSPSAGPLSVLLVDPSGSHADAIRQSLSETRSEFAVATTADARTALEALDEAAVDCIAAAYEPTEMDYVGFVEDIRERDERLPLLFFTADEDVEVIDLAPDQENTTMRSLVDVDEALAALTDEIVDRTLAARREQFDQGE